MTAEVIVETPLPESPKGDVRLLIGIASNRGWSVRFGRCLASLMLNIGLNKWGGRFGTVSMAITEQAFLLTARNEHLCMALDEGFTHFLSLDDDQTFPANLVERFLANEDKPVLTCNYRKKSPNRVEGVCADMDGKYLDSVGKTGLEQVLAMGMGCTFIRLDAIRHIPRPFYGVIWDKRMNGFLLEDGVFSGVLFEHGVPIWCDHDLSQSIGHCGEIEFRIPSAFEMAQVAKKAAAE